MTLAEAQAALAGAAAPGVLGAAASPVDCAHCGLPVPPREVEPGAAESFCCPGCRVVHGMLHDHGLSDYYAHRDRVTDFAAPAQVTGQSYAELDDPTFLERHARRTPRGLSLSLLLEGVHCSACVWLVEKLPELVPGVSAARLDYSRRVAHVDFDRATVQPSVIARALDRLGYAPHPYRAGEVGELMARDERRLLTRLGVAGASAGNVMLLALALYSGAFAGMSAETTRYFRWLSALVAAPAVLWSAGAFYRGALGALRARAAHVDVPISLGIVAASAWGLCNVLRDAGDVYFDSVTTLIFLLLAGRYLQLRQQRRAEQSAGRARALTPHVARRARADGQTVNVPAESLCVGDRVEVLAGDSFPIDGTIETGRSRVDRAWLTGEATPEPVEPGDAVFAGTLNLEGRVTVVATRDGHETRAARLLAEVERASLRRAPIALLADRLSGYFLLVVLSLAAVALAAWWPSGPAVAIDAAVALLIVTCPCALGLATPLAISAALGQAARRGWLIKGGAFVEALARPALIAFDKTGTLTAGRSELKRWFGDESLKPWVKGLEQTSSHAVARAIVAGLAEVEAAAPERASNQLGSHVEGEFAGRMVRVGSVASAPAPLGAWAHETVERVEAEGLSPVVVYVDGEARAVLGVGDPVREDAARTLSELTRHGHRLALLSGDRQAVAERVARLLERRAGRPLFQTVVGEASPESKRAFVARAAREGRVFMVGDGVNDAAALSAASVGIAVHGGAEASVAAADAFSTRAGVEPVAELLEGSRRTLGVIQVNLAVSLAYNAAAAALALAGAISPLAAAVLMPLSSLSVVSHSYRRRTFGPREAK